MRLLFFGTPDFAVPTLARLLAEPHEMVGVVSQPDRGRGRGRTVTPSPVSRLALERELPLLRPPRVGAPEIVAALREARADLGVVVAFGQFLPRSVRELTTRGYLINAHASLLPRHRGAAPIATWESPTGAEPTLPAFLVFCIQSRTSPTWLITGAGNETLEQIDEAILKAASWDALTDANEAVMETLEQAVKLRTHIAGINQHAAMIDAKGDAMLVKADSGDCQQRCRVH